MLLVNPRFFICTIALLISPSLTAAALCPVPNLVAETLKQNSNSNPDKVEIFAESATGHRETITLKDQVEVRYQGQIIKTDLAEYNSLTGQFTAPQSVSLESDQGSISGLTAEFDLSNRTALFKNAEFTLENGNRGSAAELNLQADGQQSLKGVVYSSCPKNSTGWELLAPEIVLDQENQRGYARRVKLEFANIPIFYLPYLSFPLSNVRKSGFLLPDISTSDKNGFELGIPYYWNIRENLDASFMPMWLSSRGLQLQNEFRHLSAYSQGTVNFDFLLNDRKRDTQRYYLNIDNHMQYGQNWDFVLNVSNVSDDNYFVDLGGSLTNTAISNLNREITASYYGKYWQFQGILQDFQVIDPRIGVAQEPYRRLPQLLINVDYPVIEHSSTSNIRQSLHLKTSAELVNFSRASGTNGVRVNVYPQLEHQLHTAAFGLNSTIGLQHTRYNLKSTANLEDKQPTRTLPILNIDARLNLEQSHTRKFLPDLLQPRAQYTYIPYRKQQEIPLFDTNLPDLTQNQLFNPWRFNGLDRVGDTHQIALGLSSWLIGSAASDKQLSLDVGQIFYLDSRKVGLTQDFAQDAQASEIVAESIWQPNKRLGIRTGISWDPDQNNSVKRQLGMSYRPNERKLINLGYRSIRNRAEQIDVALRYPINRRLNFIGRWNYDRLNSTSLDRYWGLEYDTCCWGLRVISRRYLSDREGNSDTSFLIQLELKGLSSVGARADKLLRDDIFINQP